MRASSLVFLLLLAALCAAPAQAASDRDPWEKWNRAMWEFDDALDRWFMEPVAKGYRKVTPMIVDDTISRFFTNLHDFPDALNLALQGDFRGSSDSLARLVANSTIGLGGLMDPAGYLGVANRDTNFGITLGKWGVPAGNYLVLPFLGPSTVRQTAGLPMDWTLSLEVLPYSIFHEEPVRYYVVGLDLLDSRADLLDFQGAVIGDRYSFFRDVYLQRTDFDVEGRVSEDPFLDDLPADDSDTH